MITLRCEQGSRDWLVARLGVPTSSAFDRIITAKKLDYSSQAEKYKNELLAEWLEGYPLDGGFSSAATERGKDMEEEARARYEFLRDVEVEQVGIVLRDDRMAGASPDGLVGDVGGLEIKCPEAHTHIGYLLNPQSLVDAYRVQVQGCLYLTGREWWDMASYHPSMHMVVERVEPDPDFQAAFGPYLDNFVAELLAGRKRLLEMGLTPAPPLPTAEDFEQMERVREMDAEMLKEQSTLANVDYLRQSA